MVWPDPARGLGSLITGKKLGDFACALGSQSVLARRYPRNLSGHVLGTVLGRDLDVPDPSLSQCLFLKGVTRGSSSLVVTVSLVFNGGNRIAKAGDDEEIDALAVDRAVGPRIGGG
jgi:hypothetical protein